MMINKLQQVKLGLMTSIIVNISFSQEKLTSSIEIGLVNQTKLDFWCFTWNSKYDTLVSLSLHIGDIT